MHSAPHDPSERPGVRTPCQTLQLSLYRTDSRTNAIFRSGFLRRQYMCNTQAMLRKTKAAWHSHATGGLNTREPPLTLQTCRPQADLLNNPQPANAPETVQLTEPVKTLQ